MLEQKYPEYTSKVVDCTTPPNLDNVAGKSVVITGGAGGMGEQATIAFAHAGAYVTFGDLNETAGRALERRLHPSVCLVKTEPQETLPEMLTAVYVYSSHAQFVPCNVTDFESQRTLFRKAIENSPSKTVDIAIANAGITGPDPIFYGEESGEEPQAPNLSILDVNVNGVIYTCKLARYHFMQHELAPGRDRCFIVLSSAAGYGDVPGGPVYMMSKFAARALMRCLRRTTFVDGVRAMVDFVKSKGVLFADAADAAGAMLKIASDVSINGRCFTIVNRQEAPLGYYDMDVDDYLEGSKAGDQQDILLSTSQRVQVKPKNQ
ncbi:hypothetical protein FE257_008062 [Aspergillus nanangensis]|uniref:Uncharacterized protein n=1 Tax=Aspergillus nanangensis TaxID=2582783 RepID=A0AAD4CM63_ASPNN|nr:hypothetical protein FE257_008062 [Aspergillus nanangensis]